MYRGGGDQLGLQRVDDDCVLGVARVEPADQRRINPPGGVGLGQSQDGVDTNKRIVVLDEPVEKRPQGRVSQLPE